MPYGDHKSNYSHAEKLLRSQETACTGYRVLASLQLFTHMSMAAIVAIGHYKNSNDTNLFKKNLISKKENNHNIIQTKRLGFRSVKESTLIYGLTKY